jgi:hypothetical protein
MNPINDPKDELLWKQARRRVSFKRQFAGYLIVNVFLWAMYFMQGSQYDQRYSIVPWPLWCTVGWGIGIAFSYYKAYHSNEPGAVEREYEKLKNEGK